MNNRRRKAILRRRKIERLRNIGQLDRRWEQLRDHRESKKLSK